MSRKSQHLEELLAQGGAGTSETSVSDLPLLWLCYYFRALSKAYQGTYKEYSYSSIFAVTGTLDTPFVGDLDLGVGRHHDRKSDEVCQCVSNYSTIKTPPLEEMTLLGIY